MLMVSPALLGFSPNRLSILSSSFRLALVVLALGALAASIALLRRRRWWAGVPVVLTIVLVGANVAAAVNAHYDYYPNVASVLGTYRGADQTSWTAAQATRAADVGRAGPPVTTLRSTPLRRASVPTSLTGRGGEPDDAPANGWPSDRIEHGQLVQVAIPGTVSGFVGRPSEVYLPPAWTEHPELRLPVMVMLHGTPGSPADWPRSARADQVSDRWASRHEGVAPILVMPDVNGRFWGDSECTDGIDGNVDTYLSVDVPRWIEAHLHPALDHHEWGVGGLSEGGLCAIDLTLRHPDVFSTFLDYSGDARVTHRGGPLILFTGSPAHRRAEVLAYDPMHLLRHFADPGRVSGWFEVGAKDQGTVAQMRQLVLIARERGFQVRFVIRPRVGHTFHTWTLSFVDSYPWMIRHLVSARPRSVAPPVFGTRPGAVTVSNRAAEHGRVLAYRTGGSRRHLLLRRQR